MQRALFDMIFMFFAVFRERLSATLFLKDADVIIVAQAFSLPQ